MGSTTGIEWTDSTHNFWIGCTKVSPGCRFCYAERDVGRFGRDFHTVQRVKDFDKPVRWQNGRRIFVNSWSDFFHEAADSWRTLAWEVVKNTPQHAYQILTKRPERINGNLPVDWGNGYPNVWLGTSVESQMYAESRIPVLLSIPAKIHFLSCEPLIGPLDLTNWLPKLQWVITGGESGVWEEDEKGKKRIAVRRVEVEWIQSIVRQCKDASVPCFVKQLGDAYKTSGEEKYPHSRKGHEMDEWPEDIRVREFPE